MEISNGKVTVAEETTGGMWSLRSFTCRTISARRCSKSACSAADRSLRAARAGRTPCEAVSPLIEPELLAQLRVTCQDEIKGMGKGMPARLTKA